MDTLLNFIIYWDIAMWALGALVMTGALAVVALAEAIEAAAARHLCEMKELWQA